MGKVEPQAEVAVRFMQGRSLSLACEGGCVNDPLNDVPHGPPAHPLPV